MQQHNNITDKHYLTMCLADNKHVTRVLSAQ